MENTEFGKILREKMASHRPQTSAPVNPMGHSNMTFDNYIPITTPRFSWAPTAIPSQYPKHIPRLKKPSPTTTKTKKKVQEPIFTLGELGLDLASAFITLTQAGAEIKENQIKLSQLKKQYRMLALRFHPDRNPSPRAHAEFQICTEAYKSIESAILLRLSKQELR